MKKIIAVSLAALALIGVGIWDRGQVRDTGPIDAIHHFEFTSQYASIKISAVVDSVKFAKNLDSIGPWINDFSNRYKYDSDLDKRVFNAKPGDTLVLDTESYGLFDFALKFRDFSHGDIDVGIGNLLRTWKISWNEQGRVPSDSVKHLLVEDLKTPFYSLDSSHHAIIILKGEHHFALGAFLEGRIMDDVANRLRQAHATAWLIDVSGDFAYEGTKPKGEPWKGEPWVLGVKDPEQPTDLMAIVRMLPDKHSFCTSGDYEQRFTDAKGKSHHHIIDPHTGESTVGKHSASVTTSIPWMNKNTLCTWFMVLPFEQIKEVVKQSNGQIETILVLDSNKVWISPGLRASTTLQTDKYKVIE